MKAQVGLPSEEIEVCNFCGCVDVIEKSVAGIMWASGISTSAEWCASLQGLSAEDCSSDLSMLLGEGGLGAALWWGPQVATDVRCMHTTPCDGSSIGMWCILDPGRAATQAPGCPPAQKLLARSACLWQYLLTWS
jgi:hypothetical protein